MMQRLIYVSFGYLKYTFACMAAATAVFFVAALAITATTKFITVLGAILAIVLIVRNELIPHATSGQSARNSKTHLTP
jgi:hypothetical protein